MKNENILNEIEELKNCLDDEVLNMFSEAVDYNGCMYICDVISDVADSCIDNYICDLLDWAKDNYDYIEEALDEFGTPKDSNDKADFFQMIKQGQYYYNEQLFYDNLEAFVKYYTLKYLIDKGICLDDEKLGDLLYNASRGIDNNNYLEDIDQFVDDYLEELKGVDE